MIFKTSRITKAAITLLVAACFCTADPVETAASSSRDVFGINADYTSVLYDSTNGMPTSEANPIAQSSDGFIWLGGYSGLVRYDGNTFYRYDSTSGISSVFALYVDGNNRIWIGINENGVAMLDFDETKVYGRVEGIRSHSVRSITEDKNGNIIIGTTQGLAYIDATTLEIHPIDDPQINQEYVNNLEKDSEGNVYGLTSDGALFTLEDLAVTAFYPSERIGGEQANSLYADPDMPGIVYIGTI